MTGELVVKAIRNLETNRKTEAKIMNDLGWDGQVWGGIRSLLQTINNHSKNELKQRESEGKLPLGVREKVKKVMES